MVYGGETVHWRLYQCDTIMEMTALDEPFPPGILNKSCRYPWLVSRTHSGWSLYIGMCSW